MLKLHFVMLHTPFCLLSTQLGVSPQPPARKPTPLPSASGGRELASLREELHRKDAQEEERLRRENSGATGRGGVLHPPLDGRAKQRSTGLEGPRKYR